MSKLRLIGLNFNKNDILDALHKTGAVQISETNSFADTLSLSTSCDKDSISKKYLTAKKCIDFYSEQIAKSKNKEYFPKESSEVLNNFIVSYDEFVSLPKNEKFIWNLIEEGVSFINEVSDIRAKKIKLYNLRQQLEPYLIIEEKLSSFVDSKNVGISLGTIKLENINLTKDFLDSFEFTDYKIYKDNKYCVILVVSLKEESDEVVGKLNELGFTKCPFSFDLTAQEKINEIDSELVNIEKRIEEISKVICEKSANIKSIKIFADYYYFLLEKEITSEGFRCTEKTFILEGYVPTISQDEVRASLNEVSNAIFIEFLPISDDEEVPVLTKNNKIITQSEFITDLYSTPNYREIDPNRIVFFFFMLFMGVIMADIGYGVLMIVVGLVLSSRIKVDNGARRLWNIIAMGGISSIIFGVLFNSFFGLGILPFSILPSPTPDLQTGEINIETIMTLLLASLGLGVLQLSVGYFYKALNCFKQGKIIDGICDGLLWVLFFIGLVLSSFNFLLDYLSVTIPINLRAFFDKTTIPGLIMIIGSVTLAALTAGRREKGFGKFSKAFGSVYGIINILSDVLSYARLFGLMLSGMIIAQTFNMKLGLPLIQGGGIGAPLGVLVIIIGHIFNIAMNVLGAYIHDSRLQYIEFFSKFYTGEGERFIPFASKFEFIYLKK